MFIDFIILLIFITMFLNNMKCLVDSVIYQFNNIFDITIFYFFLNI